MRDEFLKLGETYPKAPIWRDPGLVGSPVVRHVETALPNAVKAALGPNAARYDIHGSAGDGSWTHTPWVVLLDPAVTTSVTDGYYVVYLQSKGCERLYLTLNQGCTALKEAVGMPGAREGLARRADIMWSRVKPHAKRLKRLQMDLGVDRTVWRGKLYELGAVAGVEYCTDALPSAADMQADLLEALELYERVKRAGGWEAEDTLVADMAADHVGTTLEQAKRYRQHRSIERQSAHSRKVKKALGTRCMGCRVELQEHYGEAAAGVIDARYRGAGSPFTGPTKLEVTCDDCDTRQPAGRARGGVSPLFRYRLLAARRADDGGASVPAVRPTRSL